MTPPWQALFARAEAIAARLEALRSPLLVVKVDNETALVTLWVGREALAQHAKFPGMPSLTPEHQLQDVLTKLSRYYPAPAQSVELYAQWPGNPPRLERVARAHRLPSRREPDQRARLTPLEPV